MIIFRKLKKSPWTEIRIVFKNQYFCYDLSVPIFIVDTNLKRGCPKHVQHVQAQMAFYFNSRKRNPSQSDQHNWSDSGRTELRTRQNSANYSLY